MADAKSQEFFPFFPPLAFVLFLVLILIFWGLGDGGGWW